MSDQNHYDVIIIGSGAGGGTLAHKLAPTGKKILILERGGYVPREKDNWNPRSVNLEGKYQTKETWRDKDGNELHPHTNYYVGGNTQFFGAALFRLRKEDFGEIKHHGGLPLAIVDGEHAKSIVDAVECRLWTPLGLRSLAPDDPNYKPRYQGGMLERDGAYHQGTVWPWLIGPFVEAWLRVRGHSDEAKREARLRFLQPVLEHLNHAGLGHVSEIADADTPRGCPFQAWSLAELLRLDRVVLADGTAQNFSHPDLLR